MVALRPQSAGSDKMPDVPVYAELLDKYAHADVSLDLGLAGIARREDK